jgi:hypothetical protein
MLGERNSLPLISRETCGKSGVAVIISVSSFKTRAVSSAFVPVIEGFHANA